MGKVISISQQVESPITRKLRERAEKNAIKTYQKYLQTQNKRAEATTSTQPLKFLL